MRSIEFVYSYNLTLSLPGGDTAVLSTTGDTNYIIQYVLSESALTDPEALPVMASAESDDATLNMGIDVGQSIILDSKVTVQMDFDECEATSFICFTVQSADRASFADVVLTNNIYCDDIADEKECYPRKK